MAKSLVFQQQYASKPRTQNCKKRSTFNINPFHRSFGESDIEAISKQFSAVKTNKKNHQRYNPIVY